MAEPVRATRREVLTAALAAPLAAAMPAVGAAAAPAIQAFAPITFHFVATIATVPAWLRQVREGIDSGDADMARWLDDGGAYA